MPPASARPRARRKVNAKGFIGNATAATAHYFGNAGAMGTMPHSDRLCRLDLARRRDVPRDLP